MFRQRYLNATEEFSKSVQFSRNYPANFAQLFQISNIPRMYIVSNSRTICEAVHGDLNVLNKILAVPSAVIPWITAGMQPSTPSMHPPTSAMSRDLALAKAT